MVFQEGTGFQPVCNRLCLARKDLEKPCTKLQFYPSQMKKIQIPYKHYIKLSLIQACIFSPVMPGRFRFSSAGTALPELWAPKYLRQVYDQFVIIALQE